MQFLCRCWAAFPRRSASREKAANRGDPARPAAPGLPAKAAPAANPISEITPKSDLYSLGCILFEMLTGGFLFDGETDVEIIEKHLDSPAPKVSDLNPRCPAALSELVGRLLAKAPEDRPASAEAVCGELAELLAAHNQVDDRPDRGSIQLDDGQEGDDVESSESATLDAVPNLTERLQGQSQPEALQASWSLVAVMLMMLVSVVVAFWALSNWT